MYDNCSTDSTSSCVLLFKDPRIKYIKSDKHYTLGQARYQASQYLTGDLIAFLDSDDLWFPDHLLTHLNTHNNHSIIASYSNSLFFDEIHSKLAHKSSQLDYYCPDDLVSNYRIPLESCVISGPVFRESAPALIHLFKYCRF